MAQSGQTSSSEIRIVLLGVKDAGKSSSGNTILGRDVFQPGQRSAVCVKGQGEVAGRQVTVVETPGWFRFCDARYSAVLTRTEIEFSPRVCGNGPHCFLLAIPVNVQFTEKFQQSVLTHLDLLGSKVWGHTMVLFTHGDSLENKTVEEFIGNEGEHLQWLIEKCGNRHHILNNHTREDVTELLEKIEEMVVVNGQFEADRDRLHGLQTWKKAVKDKARVRQANVQGHNEWFQQRKASQVPSGIRITLLGQRNSGKTTARNTILGQADAEVFKSFFCVKAEGKVAGRQITVVQAPGWWIGAFLTSTLEIIKREIVLSVSLCPPGPHVVILVLHANSHFTKSVALATQRHVELLGRNVWRHTMVLFSYGDWLGNTPIEEHIESEGENMKRLLNRCGNRYHMLKKGDANGLLQKIEEMVAGKDGSHLEIDKLSLCCLQEKKNTEIERARNREMTMKKHAKLSCLHPCTRDVWLISEYRIIILGPNYSGKISSGHIMLGKEAFEVEDTTAQCLKGQGEVAGRKLTVVIPPGWWIHSDVNSTLELTKQEIVRSVSLCAPGPHAVLLTLNCSESLNQIQRRNIEEHLNLLGDKVWNHTIVLFRGGDYLRDTTVEQIIESEEVLQSLVEKCGNRYHIFIESNTEDSSQVTDLLDKIDEIVTRNAGCHYEIDMKTSWDTEEKAKQQEDDIKSRKMLVHQYSRTLEYVLGEVPQFNNIGIVLLGCQLSGKSSSGNTILGKKMFDVKHHVSVDVRGRGITSYCVKRKGEIFDRTVTVVETPGWERNYLDTSQVTKEEIIRSASLCPDGPLAYLLVLRIDKTQRTSNMSVQEHLELLGKDVWNNTIVIFPFGDIFDKAIEQHIESQVGLKSLVKKCGNRYHVINNKDRSNRTQVTELLKKLDAMLATPHSNEPVSSQREDDDYRSTSTGLDSGLGSLAKSETSSSATASGHSSGYWPSTLPQMSPADPREADIHENLSANSACTKIVDSSVMETKLSGLKLETSNAENQSQQLKPTILCTSCDHIDDDTSHWVLKEPSVSMAADVPVYKHSSPPGSFECTLSGLRWVCKEDVTLEYNFSDPGIFMKELAMLQYTPIGPLLDIKVPSGELLEAHLPHFACLDGSDGVLNDAVRVLHAADGNVTLVTCELTRFHAKIVNPSFSLTEVLVKFGIPMKTHLEVLMYRTRVTPLVLLMYVVPRDASMIQAVEEDARDSQDAKKIRKHRPDMSIWMNTKFGLKASLDDAKISPSEITLKYIRPPDLFEVFIRGVEGCFDLELLNEGQPIWKATIEPFDYGDAGAEASHVKKAVAASGYSEEGTCKEVSKATTIARTIQEEGKFAFKSNTDCLSIIRPDLIKRTSRALLKGVLDELQAHCPPVISGREAEDIMQRSGVVQDQVTAMIDVLLKKGEKACGIMLSLLRELDSYLYEDLGL